MELNKEYILEENEYYFIEERGFWMIGKVSIGNNGDNSLDNDLLRGKCHYMITHSGGTYQENSNWCYYEKDSRTFRKATPEEIFYLEKCHENKGIIPKDEIDFSKMEIYYEIY